MMINLNEEQTAIYTQYIKEVEKDLQKVKGKIDEIALYIDSSLESFNNIVKEANNEAYIIGSEFSNMREKMSEINNKITEQLKQMKEMQMSLEQFKEQYKLMLKEIENETKRVMNNAAEIIKDETQNSANTIKSITNKISTIVSFLLVVYIIGAAITSYTTWKAYKEFKVINHAYREMMTPEHHSEHHKRR
ncbi:MAG: hypothetical protein QW726_05985 [Fervidicoccaceae archaeon]